MNAFSDLEAARLLTNRDALPTELQTLWTELMPSVPMPPRAVFSSWLFCNQVGAVVAAFGETSRKARALDGKMSAEHATRFCQAVLSKHRREEQEQRLGLPERVYAAPQKEAA